MILFWVFRILKISVFPGKFFRIRQSFDGRQRNRTKRISKFNSLPPCLFALLRWLSFIFIFCECVVREKLYGHFAWRHRFACFNLSNFNEHFVFPFSFRFPTFFLGGVRRSLERIYSTHEGLGMGGKCVKSGSVNWGKSQRKLFTYSDYSGIVWQEKIPK